MMPLLRREVRRFHRKHWRAPAAHTAVAFSVLLVISGLVVGPRHTYGFQPSDVDTTRITIAKYAFEAFPTWAVTHPERDCPDGLADFSAYMGTTDTTDAWGHPIRMMCGPNLPAGAHGIAVMSAGEDGVEGTCDDIQSWAPRHECL